MNSIIPIILVAGVLTGCGESKQERARRESEERDRQTLLEMQRQDNYQRRADRDQRTLETAIKGLDILTR